MYRISAVVCTYNREKYLKKALESLSKQTINHSEFQVIIIDNNSTDNTKQISEDFHLKYPDIPYKYVVERNQGLSFARNRGINESNAEIITFIDDDAHLDKSFLEVVTKFLEKNSDAIAVGGKILLDYESEPPKWVSKYLASLFGYFNYGDKVKIFKRSTYPRGSNMTFKKKVFELVGNFNVNLGRVGRNLGGNEEKDIFHKIYAKGLDVYYLPNAIVYHAVPDSRTTHEFIKKQAMGIGFSERTRTLDSGKTAFYKALFREAFKWVASFIISLYYFITFQPQKAIMIIKFRYWVSSGLLGADSFHSNIQRKN